ncbi:uncharacterized protein LOC123310389 [Coccinella septempunctata]|uniref:uncharacterized protein LOC123310389 n=1 Tax=Coccinella septempunctata TaxID=41139 RepID=UPI001D0946F6|nr:uncharacterized protein LOC123310389 [Coccinella septempunctata]
MMSRTEYLWCLLMIAVVYFKIVESAIAQVSDLSPSNRGIDAKGILSSLAANFLSRGYYPTAAAGSQVVSLNLTNLLVLVLLKALIFAAGSIGLGHLKEKEYGYYGRSMNQKEQDHNHNLVITEDEIMLYLEYLTGNHECLKHISCQQPDQARDYANAGKLLLKASQLFSIDTDGKYEDLLREVEDAIEIGENKGNCSAFVCNSND